MFDSVVRFGFGQLSVCVHREAPRIADPEAPGHSHVAHAWLRVGSDGHCERVHLRGFLAGGCGGLQDGGDGGIAEQQSRHIVQVGTTGHDDIDSAADLTAGGEQTEQADLRQLCDCDRRQDNQYSGSDQRRDVDSSVTLA